jgi:hypothetical protein
MRKISILASLWLLSGIAAAAPQLPKKAAPSATPRSAVPAQPAKPRQSDAQIEAAIRAKFAKSKSANKFTVHVQGGIATIEGKTDVVQHKGVATRMAKTGGALAVNNRVEVSEAAKKKASDNLEQGRRRVQVKRGDSRSQTNR